MAIYVPGEFFLVIFIEINMLSVLTAENFLTRLGFGLLGMRQF